MFCMHALSLTLSMMLYRGGVINCGVVVSKADLLLPGQSHCVPVVQHIRLALWIKMHPL